MDQRGWKIKYFYIFEPKIRNTFSGVYFFLDYFYIWLIFWKFKISQLIKPHDIVGFLFALESMYNVNYLLRTSCTHTYMTLCMWWTIFDFRCPLSTQSFCKLSLNTVVFYMWPLIGESWPSGLFLKGALFLLDTLVLVLVSRHQNDT